MGKQQSSGCQTPVLLYDWLHFAIDVTHFITSLQWTKYNRWLFFFTEKQNKKKLQRKKTFQRTKLTWRMFGQNWGQHSFWDLYHTWHLKDEVFFFAFIFFFFFYVSPPSPLKRDFLGKILKCLWTPQSCWHNVFSSVKTNHKTRTQLDYCGLAHLIDLHQEGDKTLQERRDARLRVEDETQPLRWEKK